jgi:NaMN:DMB phosphoribosyltransferase
MSSSSAAFTASIVAAALGDDALRQRVQSVLDGKTKPPGSLGRLEALALKLALLLGEMGIANTSAAALLMARLTGEPLQHCVGRGTGLDDAGLAHKQAVLERALDRHAGARAAFEVLTALGGLEIATMVGAIQQAAARGRIVSSSRCRPRPFDCAQGRLYGRRAHAATAGGPRGRGRSCAASGAPCCVK